ncbi:MAG: hypothetical protein DRJ50_06760 [Actinobacteria bacterium]|nr:MAG: hypothetical protein DRJ50_06760 [Actinomycetota bacterium]
MLGSGLMAALIAVPVIAAEPLERIDQPVSAVESAESVSPLATDVVTVYNSGPLDMDVADRAVKAAQNSGASVAIGRAASIGMIELRRGSTVIQRPASGFAIPMGTTVLPPGLIGRTMGGDVSKVLSPTSIVMSSLTASLRGAKAGDTIDLVASWGGKVTFKIGAVIDDTITGGTELLMTPEAADRLGISRLSRVVIWGFSSRSAINSAMSKQGLVSTSIRIRRSWDPADPDFTLGMARTKAALGEFAYRVNSNGSVTLDSAWKSAHIVSGSVGQLNLSSGCHKTVRTALSSAMSEVIASGLEYTINYYDANRAGGCYYPRFNRLTPNSAVGFLSRHSWGMAIDTNTIGSCQGCAPPDMNCDTVRIFRKHGFAWGGNFLTPDGMHFEWVGEARDQQPYPSRFCPNIVPNASELQVEQTERATFYADDGLISGDLEQ